LMKRRSAFSQAHSQPLAATVSKQGALTWCTRTGMKKGGLQQVFARARED
jgi:hypothetical protein